MRQRDEDRQRELKKKMRVKWRLQQYRYDVYHLPKDSLTARKPLTFLSRSASGDTCIARRARKSRNHEGYSTKNEERRFALTEFLYIIERRRSRFPARNLTRR